MTLKALEEMDATSKVEPDNSTDKEIFLVSWKLKQMLKCKRQEKKRFPSREWSIFEDILTSHNLTFKQYMKLDKNFKSFLLEK